jgi:hypothetical protein
MGFPSPGITEKVSKSFTFTFPLISFIIGWLTNRLVPFLLVRDNLFGFAFIEGYVRMPELSIGAGWV